MRIVFLQGLAAGALCLLGPGGALADCTADAAAASRFQAEGDVVTDRATGLVWARCSVGQTWSDGRCEGVPRKFTHNEANEASFAGFRMPALEELKMLISSRCRNPVIDTDAFPGTPPDWYHTATKKGSFCWFVGFRDGEIGDGPICDSEYLVRLVKAP